MRRPAEEKALSRIQRAKAQKSRVLDLSELELTVLSPEIGQLNNLQGLNLSGNQLTALPAEIGELTNLQWLYLYHNKLTTLPSEIGKLTNLRVLRLWSNDLSKIPPEIGKLSRLQELIISANLLTSLPADIGQLTKLERLNISYNQITSLPAEICHLTNLRFLDIDKNFLPDAHITAYAQGIDHFCAYLASLEQEADTLYEAKLLLVGEGTVGKTSLLAALKGEAFYKNRATTHGVEIERVSIPHPDGEHEISFNAWDFGGQEVYRGTNQFFYSPHAVYLLLWDARAGMTRCDVLGWLERIKLRVGTTAKVIIVATCQITGDHYPFLELEMIREKYGEIITGTATVDSGVLADGVTQADDGDLREKFGIVELRRQIADVAATLPRMGKIQFNTHWRAARDEVLALRERETPEPHISTIRFAQICARHGLDELATETLAVLMAELGYTLYYPEIEGLKEHIVLQPEWVTKAIGYVLEDPPTIQTSGILDHRRLYGIWADQVGREHYAPTYHPFFLRMMERFDVSYRLDEGSSLVAQLVPEQHPHLPWQPADPCALPLSQVQLACTWTTPPPGLMPWMIVRTHRYAPMHRRHWKKGTFLEYPPHGQALLEMSSRELLITVRATYPDYFLSILQETLLELIEEHWPGLVYELKVPCKGEEGQPCSKQFGLLGLRKYLAKGHRTIGCEVCCSEQDVSQLLLGFSLAAERQIAMQQIGMQINVQGNWRQELEYNLSQTFQQDEGAFQSKLQAAVMLILRSLSAESRTAPRLFSLLPTGKKGLTSESWQLNLWCEMPDCQHPSCQIGSGGPGEYLVQRPKEWFVRSLPALRTTAEVLKWVIRAAKLAGAAWLPDADGLLGRMNMGLSALNGMLEGDLTVAEDKFAMPEQMLHLSEGSALRAMHELLFDLDPQKQWGHLRCVATPTGDHLWLCPEHYASYNPAPPKL